MITQRDNEHLVTETIKTDAASDSHERWSRVRWYADAARAERRSDVWPGARAEAHINFLSLFLDRALSGNRRSDSHA